MPNDPTREPPRRISSIRDDGDAGGALLVLTTGELARMERETLRTLREQIGRSPARAALRLPIRTQRRFYETDRPYSAIELCVSPGRRRCAVVQGFFTSTHRTRIHVWSLPGMRFESEIEAEAWKERDSTPLENKILKEGTVRWGDDDHLLISGRDGALECHRASGGLVWRKILGDCIGTLATEGDLLAVSLFPPVDVARMQHPHAEGLKLYRIDGDIERGELRLLAHLGREGGPTPARLCFRSGGSALYVQGGWIRDDTIDAHVAQIDLDRARLGAPADDALRTSQLNIISLRELHRQMVPRDNSFPHVGLAPRSDGFLIAADQEGWRALDPSHPVVLPPVSGARQQISSLEVSVDGEWVVATCGGGLQLSHNDGVFERITTAELGAKVSQARFVGDRELLVVLDLFPWYELARFDIESRCLRREGDPSPPIRMPEAHTTDAAGRLCVGTNTGSVRRFDSKLEAVDRSNVGNSVSVLVAEPGSNRLVAVTSERHHFWLDGAGALPRNHRSTDDGPGEGPIQRRGRAFFTPKGSLYVSSPANRHAFVDGEAVVLVLYGLPCARIVNRHDILGQDLTADSSFSFRAHWGLPLECSGIAAVGNEVILLACDGRLLRFDHRRCPLRAGAPTTADLPEDPIDPNTLREILRVSGPTIGMTALGPGEIVSWTAKELTIVTLDSATLAESGRRTVPLEDVTSVQRDPRNGGFITAHGSHLSFFTADLVEHLRMLTLFDDTILWQAPPPPGLAATGHPGYFWREEGMNGAFLSAFRVLDQRGDVVEKHEAKRAFLGQYFSRELVVRASRDWSGYLESLERAKQRVVTSTPRLLSTWSGGDTRSLPDDPP
jgi:hypothetical protein